MHFDLTREQELIRRTVREFAEKEIAPRARHVDETGEFPAETFAKMGKLGLMGLPFPEEYGGAGADTISAAIAVEEVARVCGSTALAYAAHMGLGSAPIFMFGTEEQKRKFLV
ncbi:MAG: acyl-CoA dehydrogenase family protein, partial [Chloroflexaceae bacterium]